MNNVYLVAAKKIFNVKIYKAAKCILAAQGEVEMLAFLQQYVREDIREYLAGWTYKKIQLAG